MSKSAQHPTAQQIIQCLGLKAHMEGGYFRRSYQADQRPKIPTGAGERFLLTSIYYLLTHDSSVGHWHLNESDILHYFHLGDPIEYSLIHSDGTLQQAVLGANLVEGQQLQMPVAGGVWKTSRLLPGVYGYGLISEAVSPGFDYSDMTIGNIDTLLEKFPQHRLLIEKFTKN